MSHYKKAGEYNNMFKFKNAKLENMLDLTDSSVLNSLNIDKSILLRTSDDVNYNYHYTGLIGTWAQSKGYNGLIVPGARGTQNYKNVILFGRQYIEDTLGGLRVKTGSTTP